MQGHVRENPTLAPKIECTPDFIPERPELDMRYIFLIGNRVKQRWDDYAAEQERGGYAYSFDGVHFTPETAQAVGETVATFIQRHIT